MQKSQPAILRLVLKFSVAVAVLTWLGWQLDLNAVFARISLADPVWAVLAILLLLTQTPLVAWRVSRISSLLGITLLVRPMIPLQALSVFSNLAMPTSLGGDVMRVVGIVSHGAETLQVLRVVALDRFVGILGVLLAVIAALPWAIATASHTQALIVIGFVCLFGIAASVVLSAFPGMLRPIPWVGRPASALLAGLEIILRRGGAASARILISSAAVHFLTATSFWAIAHGIGMQFRLSDCIAFVLPAMLSTALPLSIGGWGIREGAIVGALMLAGIPSDESFAAAVLFGLTITLSGVVNGLVWLAFPKQQIVKSKLPREEMCVGGKKQSLSYKRPP